MFAVLRRDNVFVAKNIHYLLNIVEERLILGILFQSTDSICSLCYSSTLF